MTFNIGRIIALETASGVIQRAKHRPGAILAKPKRPLSEETIYRNEGAVVNPARRRLRGRFRRRFQRRSARVAQVLLVGAAHMGVTDRGHKDTAPRKTPFKVSHNMRGHSPRCLRYISVLAGVAIKRMALMPLASALSARLSAMPDAPNIATPPSGFGVSSI